MNDFTAAEEVASQSDGSIVEIGSDRGEQSTQALMGIALQHGRPFHTVDVDPERYAHAKQLVGGAAHQAKGEDFLAAFHDPISFLYLDNFDWQWDGRESGIFQGQIDRYAVLGLSMTNLNSQATHLLQAIRAFSLLTPRCAIMIDDTFRLNDGTFSGKGGACVPYLVGQGMSLTLTSSTRVLLRR